MNTSLSSDFEMAHLLTQFLHLAAQTGHVIAAALVAAHAHEAPPAHGSYHHQTNARQNANPISGISHPNPHIGIPQVPHMAQLPSSDQPKQTAITGSPQALWYHSTRVMAGLWVCWTNSKPSLIPEVQRIGSPAGPLSTAFSTPRQLLGHATSSE